MIEYIVISIYDTTLPASGIGGVESIIDYAEKNSVKWIWEGTDDKFTILMASRVEFDMEVSIGDSLYSLVYGYLFTGNEKKYRVEMKDQKDNILWQGFLLPEEYTEPYQTGTFYIHLTATDGIGNLSGQILDKSFYAAKQSVVKVIADCLRKTGLDFEIWINPAIANDFSGARWEHVFVDANDWWEPSEDENEEDEYTDAYQMLEDVVTLMGCTLFQQNNKWYLKSWKNNNNRTWQIYDSDGRFVMEKEDSFLLVANIMQMYDIPQIAIKPPFKEVEVKMDLAEKDDLLPEDVVAQEWEVESAETNVPITKYWKLTSEMESVTELELFPTHPTENFKTFVDEAFVEKGLIGFEKSRTINIPEPPNLYYISLLKPVFVKSGLVNISLKYLYHSYSLSTGGESESWLKRNMIYEIFLDNTVIATNKWEFPNRSGNNYQPEITIISDIQGQGYPGTQTATARLDLNKFKISRSGFLNIRIYHPEAVVGSLRSNIRLESLSVSYTNNFSKSFKRRRVIDFTNKKSLQTNFGDSVLNIKNTLHISTSRKESFFSSTPVVSAAMEKGVWKIKINPVWHIIFSAQPDKIFLKKTNSDFYEYLEDITFETGVFMHNYKIIINAENDYKVKPGDELCLWTVEAPIFPGGRAAMMEYKEKWRKLPVEDTRRMRLGHAIAETIHDVYPEPLLTIEAEVKGIVQPLDPLWVNVNNQLRKFLAARIEVNVNENSSSVLMIEDKSSKVVDYE